jgi:hypothetical protein
MITNFKLFEGKQVGILYHWTDLQSLINILRDDKMLSWRGYISFSRNKNLEFENKPCKIIFDGDKMSNHFKFKPHLYRKSRYYKDEAEERVKCNDYYSGHKYPKDLKFKNDCIKNIKKYIIGIELDSNKYEFSDQESIISGGLETIQKYANNVPVNIIEKKDDN